MTIKQQGGIFGRNPTFNNVDVDSTLSVNEGTLYVDPATGRVGVNTTAPASRFDVLETVTSASIGTIATFRTSSGGYFYLRASDRSAASPDWIIGAATGEGLKLHAGNSETMSLNPSGDVEISAGNLVIGTSGNGIDFSATSGTGTSELFDDYEEGTFTPEVEGTSTAGTYTYATQTGVYTKVGDLVTVTINLVDITESVAGSGSLRIASLPFTANGTHVGSLWARSVNFDASAAYLVPYASGNAIFINEVVDSASGAALNIADLTSGSARLYITMTYKV